MVAKTIIFYAGRGVFKINMGKLEQKIEVVQKKFQKEVGIQKKGLLFMMIYKRQEV
jgi:hypothetical protein